MDFDEENNEIETGTGKEKSQTFFGLEIGNGVVYRVVIILTLIFIREVSGVPAALS